MPHSRYRERLLRNQQRVARMSRYVNAFISMVAVLGFVLMVCAVTGWPF